MKKKIISFFIILFLLIVPIGGLLTAGFVLPSRYDETYSGELRRMVTRLQSASKKKIVLIGNSSIAFGIRPDWIEKELPDYQVVNFGLYGAIGTRAMLDLSLPTLKDGDVVVIAPEMAGQSLSLYFSGTEFWRAADGCFSLLLSLPSDVLPAMAGSFPVFAREKLTLFFSGSKPAPDSAYRLTAFEQDGYAAGYMTYERPCNEMPLSYDPNQPVSFTADTIGEGFLDYLNDYYEKAYKRGAKVFFDFAPVNRLALTPEVNEEQMDTYVSYLSSVLKFPVIGDPGKYVLDHEWFYDTNFHMNSAGMWVHTRLLLEDIKNALGITTPTSLTIPDKPESHTARDVAGMEEDGTVIIAGEEITDDEAESLFLYQITENGAVIIGLTEEGRSRTHLAIPSTLGGAFVFSFEEQVFAGDTTLVSLTIPDNIKLLYNNSFDGCVKLTSLILKHSSPSAVATGFQLLKGAPSCRIYVPAEALAAFQAHYTWGTYSEMMFAVK